MLSDTLIHMGFRPTRSDTSLFIRNTSTSTILLLIYVDDIIITSSSQAEMNSLILTLHTKFSLKDLDPLHHFLGIEVSHTSDGGLFLSQK
uniref:Reverse transcriptase Ty1/copia-type domain-containing protein n=1 Tax=Cajanus cajan TaxID=3821 RepID=A0A151U9K8_CAJCA|nr:hypothetical protein KK1_020140 [Cajanus cajan]